MGKLSARFLPKDSRHKSTRLLLQYRLALIAGLLISLQSITSCSRLKTNSIDFTSPLPSIIDVTAQTAPERTNDSVRQTSSGDAKAKIVLATDLHVRSKSSLYERLFAEILLEAPDLLIFGGDSFETAHGLSLFLSYIKESRKLSLTCPILYILGNWEYRSKVNVTTLREQLQEVGLTLLVNEYADLYIQGKSFHIYGTDDAMFGYPRLWDYRSDPASINLILAHNPVVYDLLLREKPVSACPVYIFSGHTHDGQIKIFDIPLILQNTSKKYAYGIFQDQNYTLFVSRGIGTSRIPLRLNCPPELAILYF